MIAMTMDLLIFFSSIVGPRLAPRSHPTPFRATGPMQHPPPTRSSSLFPKALPLLSISRDGYVTPIQGRQVHAPMTKGTTPSEAPTTRSDPVRSSDKEGGGIGGSRGTSRRVRVSEVVLVVGIGGE
eukprot:scaffold302908_cov50-Attheya_sp.AAC.1